jgi:uncharacterized repeat protein (TIGR03803 family)
MVAARQFGRIWIGRISMLSRKVLRTHAAGRPLTRASMTRAGLVAAIALAIGLPAKAAPHESVLFAFPGGPAGHPEAGLVIGAGGALYGTTAGNFGCGGGCGTVFKLTPPGSGATLWSETVLHRFRGGADGSKPEGGLIIGADGALFGTTAAGGASGCDCGTVFMLTPPATGESRWTETVLYRFKGGTDGASPAAGLTGDANGVLYGTTEDGGSGCDCGTVFALTPPLAGERRWTETVLYRFKGGTDGAYPLAGLVIDANGALYGTTSREAGSCFGFGCGTAFMLTPPKAGETAWTESVLYRFRGNADGVVPEAGLAMDANGILYGTTFGGGGGTVSICCGTVFALTPPKAGETPWTESVLHRFTDGADGAFPQAGLIIGTNGTLYGTTAEGGGCGNCFGTVFELAPPAAGTGNWAENVLHGFAQGSDGSSPVAGLVMDANGALYGTTYFGGGACRNLSGCGIAFKLVP